MNQITLNSTIVLEGLTEEFSLTREERLLNEFI